MTVQEATATSWTTRRLLGGVPMPPSRFDRSGVWHSQLSQDRIVATLLRQKRSGYFVDAASSEPLLHSNTRTLERDFGWSGLCIEANPRFWNATASMRKRCCLVGAAVAERRAEMNYHSYPNAFAGMGGLIRPGTKNAFKPPSMAVQAVTMAEVLKRFNAPPTIDFMSLDVEGAEELAMRAFPFDVHTVSIMSIERPRAKLVSLLQSHGYRYHCTSVLSSQLVGSLKADDQIWLHDSADLDRRTHAARPSDTVRCDWLYASAPLGIEAGWSATDNRSVLQCDSNRRVRGVPSCRVF